MVHRVSNDTLHLGRLLLDKYVSQAARHGARGKTAKLNRWEGELALLHICIDLLIEVLAHVCFENHREVIPIPRALVPCLTREMLN